MEGLKRFFYKYSKIIIISMLILSISVIFLPIIKIQLSGLGIGVKGFRLTDIFLLDVFFSAFGWSIQDFVCYIGSADVYKYIALCKVIVVLFVLLPIAESVIIGVTKPGKLNNTVSIVSILVNNILAITVYVGMFGVVRQFNSDIDYLIDDFMGDFGDYGEGLGMIAGFLGLGDPSSYVGIGMGLKPVIVWIFCYAVIVAALVIRNACKPQMQQPARQMQQIQMQQPARQMQQPARQMQQPARQMPRPTTQAPVNPQPEPVNVAPSAAVSQQKAFNGAIIGRSGRYNGKAMPFRNDEVVSVGTSDSNTVKLEADFDNSTLCTIRFDKQSGEYIVRPLETKAVFLKSGQPLGQDREYRLARGKVLVIGNNLNVFELA